MRRLTRLLLAMAILAATAPATAHEGVAPGYIQRYGGLWRYQKRDWSQIYGRPNPGVCWQWDARSEQLFWTC